MLCTGRQNYKTDPAALLGPLAQAQGLLHEARVVLLVLLLGLQQVLEVQSDGAAVCDVEPGLELRVEGLRLRVSGC